MANILTIDTTSSAIVPAIYVRTPSGNYTLVGQFSYYNIGNKLFITGTSSILQFDLTTDTATINGSSSLGAAASVVALNTQFIN
ncbi:MAG: hypothetical protein ACR2IL_02310 [Chitinophagaceae bacterium]